MTLPPPPANGPRRTSVYGPPALATLRLEDDGPPVLHYQRCDSCAVGVHPGGDHPWAGPEDLEHVQKTRQSLSLLAGVCGCYCVDEEPAPEEEPPPPELVSLDAPPCPLCGETGACGYDSEGRALIHSLGADDGED